MRGLVKLIVSFIVIAYTGLCMQREDPDKWPSSEMWKFEIPAAILAAGWIMRDGW